MLSDRWGSDRDYEAAMGTHGPSTASTPPPTPTEAELAAAGKPRDKYPLLHRIADSLREMSVNQPVRRCPHGINLDAAGCGRCLEGRL